MTASAPSATRPRLLVVDDSEVLVRAMARILSAQYAVTVAVDGRAALTHLRTTRFDAVVCDIAMPRMNGVELYVVLLQEDPEHARRFVFVTGGGDSPSARFLGSQVSVLYKPFDMETLHDCIEAVRAGHVIHAGGVAASSLPRRIAAT
jgi:CheY-like chemotaxis protein